jgi:hypothetical protein
MTLENCKKYLEEAKDEATKKFWADRIARKYPQPVVVEEVKEVKVKKVKKENVEDDSR